MKNKQRIDLACLIIVIVVVFWFVNSSKSNNNTPIEHAKKPAQKVVLDTCEQNNSCGNYSNYTPIPHKHQAELVEQTAVSSSEPKLVDNGMSFEVLNKCKVWRDSSSIDDVNRMLLEQKDEIELSTSIHKVSSHLTLKVIAPALPPHFINTLKDKIHVVLHLYEKWFGLTLYKHEIINLIILPSQASYQDTLARLSIDSLYSQGLFTHQSNVAYAAFRTPEQLASTALHESVHAINSLLIGYQPRWLSEGLAEFFEKMTIRIENNTVHYSLNDLNDSYTSHDYPLDSANLIYSEAQWSSEQRQHLYFSARHALSYFLHDDDANSKGVQLVRHLLQQEAKHHCDQLSSETYLQMIDERIIDLSPSFHEWTKGTLENAARKKQP